MTLVVLDLPLMMGRRWSSVKMKLVSGCEKDGNNFFRCNNLSTGGRIGMGFEFWSVEQAQKKLQHVWDLTRDRFFVVAVLLLRLVAVT